MTDSGAGGSGDNKNTEPLEPPSPRPPSDGPAPGAESPTREYSFPAGTAPAAAASDIDGVRFDDGLGVGLLAGVRAPTVPDVPSPISARYLFPTEKYRGEWRRHWVHLMPWYIIGTLSTFIMGLASGMMTRMGDGRDTALTVTIVLWLLILGFVGWKILDWYMDRFILTNKRIMLIQGVITRSVAMMPLGRVTDMKYAQTPMGRMLNYGEFIIESAGQDQALRNIPHLPNPNELYLQMCEEMYEPEAVDEREAEPEEDLIPEEPVRKDAEA
ncbi:PH domain-containing protein [Glycomyces harbinensis]|uniref:PH domain-containing protein n=1 Tax=Glycomyces harbinensis TaxID=58114 RepID=A0A1G6UUE1_9ACTN|nr:PH domain-containing protein [Glycomyces harbinensis]SDD45040.1 PH domain-containing protein [Glycomyces harbinensis]